MEEEIRRRSDEKNKKEEEEEYIFDPRCPGVVVITTLDDYISHVCVRWCVYTCVYVCVCCGVRFV